MGTATLVASVESLAALKSEWNSVLSRSSANTVFSTWDWQEIWWGAFGKGAEPLLIAIREASELVGIAPLVKRASTISFVGGSDVSDYLDFITVRGREQDVLVAVFDHLKRWEWDELDLHCVRHDSPTLQYLPGITRAHGLTYAQEVEDVCPVADLPSDWEMFVGSLSKKDRHELRRKIRRLEAADNFAWYVAPPAADTTAYIQDFFRLCSLSRHEKAVFLDDKHVEQFFREMTQRFQPTGVLKIYFLEVGGERVSATLCFDQGRELWLYNSGFDPLYSNLSVGLLLKAFCIKDAIERGKTRFDFLRGREPYKYDLGGKDTAIYRLRIRKAVS